MQESDFCVKLDSLAEIRTGCTLRERPHPAAPEIAALRLLTIGDLTPEGDLQEKAPLLVEADDRFKRHMVAPGDVIFRGKAAGFSAAVIEVLTRPTAVAAPLILILPDRDRIEPAFLAWAINSPNVRAQMDDRARGSVAAFVGARDLADLVIPLPSFETQRRIAALAKLARAEAAIEERLLQKRRQYLDFVLLEAARKNPAPHERDRASPPVRVDAPTGKTQPPGRKKNPNGDHDWKV